MYIYHVTDLISDFKKSRVAWVSEKTEHVYWVTDLMQDLKVSCTRPNAQVKFINDLRTGVVFNEMYTFHVIVPSVICQVF